MDSSNNEKKSIGKSGAIVIVLGVAIFISIAVIAVAIFSSMNSDSTDDSTGYNYSYSENGNLPQTTQNGYDDFLNDLTSETQTEKTSSSEGQQGNNGTPNKETTKNAFVEKYEKVSKNGDNMLSDHHENQYIKLVAGEYNVDTDLLVAIYSVPDTGNNFVLEFSGKKDSSGNIIKSPDTLKKVYQIDINRNIKVATENGVGNVGVSYAEGILCFNMVKTIVMEQYPDYFTGIEQ